MLGSVSATRFGIMKGTFEDGLPSPSSTRPVGYFSLMTNVLASSTSMLSTNDISFWPVASLARPALDGGDAILGGDRLAVVPERGRRAG